MAWVISDYIATPGTDELTVRKGQHVEVLNCNHTDFCLIRMGAQGHPGEGSQEGLVPITVLKLTPTQSKNISKQQQQIRSTGENTTIDDNGDGSSASPVSKRRSFGG